MKYILGINAFHADASAVLLEEGNVIAAIEEEKFTRLKHWSGFPKKSIEWCLNYGNINFSDISHIGINTNPKSTYLRKIKHIIFNKPNFKFYLDRLKNSNKGNSIRYLLEKEFCDGKSLKSKIHYLDHHYCHMSSAYFPSNYDYSAVLSVDGFGDFCSTAWGIGSQSDLNIKKRIFFPHSLGAFYTAITQFLGFENYGDEYKVMGLAPYGEPIYVDNLKKFLILKDNGTFSLDQKYIYWEKFKNNNEGYPQIYTHFHKNIETILGLSRKPNEDILQRHKDIACSLQALYELAFFNLLNKIYSEFKVKNLCIAGGCGANSVANGKITFNTGFENVYIHPAPGDAGGALGAALAIWNKFSKQKSPVIKNVYLGYESNDSDILNSIEEVSNLKKYKFYLKKIGDNEIKNESKFLDFIVDEIIQGKVIGWFQGRLEWGPRALGNRSIIGDPRRTDMRDIINKKIKKRESFRPFAPSILQDKCGEWFVTKYENDNNVPHMTKVYKIKESKRDLIPAVCHVDGTGRLQTVSEYENKRYFQLINKFFIKTNVPMLLNTSFNENEPIVCKSKEALDCFFRTKMDILVVGDFILQKIL